MPSFGNTAMQQSLPDTETTEDPVQHFVDVHSANECIQGAHRLLHVMRGKHGIALWRQVRHRLAQGHLGPSQGSSMTFPGQHRLQVGQLNSLPKHSFGNRPAKDIDAVTRERRYRDAL